MSKFVALLLALSVLGFMVTSSPAKKRITNTRINANGLSGGGSVAGATPVISQKAQTTGNNNPAPKGKTPQVNRN